MAGKRPVAPDTPIRSFPTPNINDLVVVVDVDSRLPGYKPLEYGTPHPDQTRFRGAKLVYQEPVDGTDQFVRRIYATDRADQDAYNYAIKYSAGSPGHPIYLRSYVLPREDYTPLPEGSADSQFPDAFLIEEEMAPVEGELNSLYVKVTRVYETLPGPVITSFETNEAGQKVTVTSQRKSSANYTLPAATATSNPSAQAEDTGVVTEQIRSVPAVFARKQFSAERPDPLPTKFRAAVPDVETSEIVAGTAQQPTLSVPQELSASETQETVFLKRISRRLRPPSYPVTFVETVRTNTGQIATTTSVLLDELQTADTGPLVESSEVTDLGDGRSIKVTTEVDQVFEQPSFTRSKEDLTPQKFRAAVSETVEERTVSGQAEMPASLAADEFAKTEEQLTVDRKRVRVQERSLTSESTLEEQIVTPEGQLATRTLTLSNQPQSVEPSATLVQGEIEQLGDGRTVKTEVIVNSVFDERRVVKERPDLVPPEFRGAVPTETTETVIEGTTAAMPILAPGELSRSAQRVSEHKVRTSVVTRPDANFPVTLAPTDTLVDNDGVTVTRVKTLASGAQTLNPSATVSGSVENIGDGLTVKTQDTKAEVFGSETFGQEKPDNVPAEFRVAVPETITEATVAGTAAPFTLGSNEITKTEQQVTKFTKRTRTVSRTLPGSTVLNLGEQIDQDGVKVTVVRTLAEGAQPITPTALVSGQVEDLGGGRTVQTLLTKAEVFDGAAFTRIKEDLTPQKFRASVSEQVTETTSAGAAEMPASLAADEFEKSEQQVNKFTKRTRTRLRQTGVSNTLTEQVVTPQGQLALRTLTLLNSSQSVTPSALLVDGEVEQLGDGRTVKTEVVVPSVFDERRVAVEKPDLVPPEFRGAVPTQTTETVESGTTATMPTLATGELARSRQRVSEHRIRTSLTTRPTTNLPVTLGPNDTLVDNDGVTVTRVKTLASGAQILTPSATVSGSIENIGDGLTVRTLDVKAEVFSGSAFTRNKEDLTPQKFRAVVAEEVVESTVEGTASMPLTLAANEFEKTEQQVNKFTKRTRTRTRNIQTDNELEEQVITNDGQLATRRLILSDQPQTVTPSATIVSGEVEQLGDGRTVKTEVEVPAVFANANFTRVKEDITPQKFKALVSETIEESTTEGTAAMPASLAPEEFEKSEQQVNVFTKRTRTRRRVTGLTNSFTEQVITPQGQLATRTLTLSNQPLTITPSALVVEGQVEALGDGRSISTTVQVPSVFEEKSLELEKPDVTPQKFRATLPSTVVESTVSGTVGSSITLSGNEISKSERQLTAFTKRTRTLTRNAASSATINTGRVFTTDLGGGLATVTEKYGPVGSTTVSSGYGTVSAEREDLGDGQCVVREVNLTPPLLSGQRYDEAIDIVVPFTQQVVSASNQLLGTNRVDIEPRDIHHSVSRTIDIASARSKLLDEQWSVAAYVNMELPDVLLSVESIRTSAKSYGKANSTGTNYSLRASGSASQTIDFRWRIRNGYNGPVPATRHVFFLDKGNASFATVAGRVNAAAFPTLFPEPVVITSVSGSVTKEVSASSFIDLGSGNSSAGTGESFGNSLSSSVTTIPPTLHGDIPITEVDVTLGAVTTGDPDGTGTANTQVNQNTGLSFVGTYAPTTITATTPHTAFPAGDYVVSIETESYKFRLVKVTCVVAHITSTYV